MIPINALMHAANRYLDAHAETMGFHGILGGDRNVTIAVRGHGSRDARPIAAHMDECRAGTDLRTADVVDAALAARDDLAWWAPYAEDAPAGAGFFANAAVTTLAGEGAPFASDAGRAGLFYVRAGVEYAPHAHAPREIYAILSGRARYWNEATGWREAGAGDVILTPEHSWHAMKTGSDPVLILWAWTGEGMTIRPHFRDDTGALPPEETK